MLGTFKAGRPSFPVDFKTRDLPLQEMKVSILKDKTSGDGQAGILPIAHGLSAQQQNGPRRG